MLNFDSNKCYMLQMHLFVFMYFILPNDRSVTPFQVLVKHNAMCIIEIVFYSSNYTECLFYMYTLSVINILLFYPGRCYLCNNV